MDAIRAAQASGDRNALAERAHALKGAASNAAAPALSAIAARIETLAPEGRADAMATLVASLGATWERTALAMAIERERLLAAAMLVPGNAYRLASVGSALRT